MDLFSSKKVKCAGCGNTIEKKEAKVEAMKKQFHAACFVCTKCDRPLQGDFRPVDDKPWCEDCFAKTKAPKCDGCGKGILDKRIKTDDGQSFHESCFANASQGTCASCGDKIGLSEQLTDALGKSFHSRCFRCGRCGSDLPAEFHVKNDIPICNGCNKHVTAEENQKQAAGGETIVRDSSDENQNPNEGIRTQTIVRDVDGNPEITEYREQTFIVRDVDSQPRLDHEQTDTFVRGSNNEKPKQTPPLRGTEQTDTFVRGSEGGEPQKSEPQGGKQQTDTFVRGSDGGQEKQGNGNRVLGQFPAHRKSNVRDDVEGDNCAVCAESTTGTKHVKVRGKHFHRGCFDNAHSGECYACNQKIRLTERSVSVANLGRDWHISCLSCGKCSVPISGKFSLRNDEPVCEDCDAADQPKCASCDQSIDGNRLKAMATFWHPDCFSCTECKDPLHKGGKEFFNLNGKPYCKKDYETLRQTA